jgi:hypothetical protein
VLWAYGDASFAPSGREARPFLSRRARSGVSWHGQDAVGATQVPHQHRVLRLSPAAAHDVKRGELSEYAAALEKARKR